MEIGMGNQLRYLDLGSVSKEMYISLWEFDSVIDLTEPLIIKFSTEKTLVSFFQGPYYNEDKKEWENYHTDLSDYFHSKELSDIDKVRYYQKVEIDYDAVVVYYVESPNVTNFIYFFPNCGHPKDKNKRKLITDLWFNSVEETLEKTNVGKCKHANNDLFFKRGDKWKKFLGSMYRTSPNNWGNSEISITYDFDSETANRVRTFDSKVKMKKFNVDDIQDIVGGLWEIDPTIDKDELDFEVVQRMSNHLGYTIRHDNLTYDEEDLLFERGHRRMTEKDWYLYGKNDGFI
jgi:lipoate-protein ligase A